jgi:hypothetical protein
MTGTASDGQSPPEDLTARVFRALYDQFDLHVAGGTHIAVPAVIFSFLLDHGCDLRCLVVDSVLDETAAG